MQLGEKIVHTLLVCLVMTGAALSLSGCGLWNKIKFKDAQYWQRANLRDSFQMDHAGKQQWLNRDIAGCVADMKELGVTGGLRDGIPGPGGENADEAELADWDTPEREGYLNVEHKDFPDFEACMNSRGWRRTDNVNYDTAKKSEETYLESRGITPESKKRKEVDSDDAGNGSYINF
jgi:hypothetical protein